MNLYPRYRPAVSDANEQRAARAERRQKEPPPRPGIVAETMALPNRCLLLERPDPRQESWPEPWRSPNRCLLLSGLTPSILDRSLNCLWNLTRKEGVVSFQFQGYKQTRSVGG